MNKIGISVLSAMATLGVVCGAGAIALSTPSIKEKLNISYADNILFGKDTKVEIPEMPESPEEESFSDGLANRNLALVNYQIGAETIIKIVEKDSPVELVDVPRVAGCTFIGWTDNVETNDLVGQVKSGMTLYPVYISNERHITFNCYTRDTSFPNHINTANQFFGNTFDALTSATGTFTTYLLGLTEDKDSKVMLKNFENGKNYYPVLYVQESKKVCSFNEYIDEYSKFQCGISAMNNVTLHTYDSVLETQVYKTGSMVGSELTIGSVELTLAGFSLSPDSTSIVNKQVMLDGGIYYAVYERQYDRLMSLNSVKQGWDAVIHVGRVAYNIELKKCEELADYTTRYSVDNGVVFNFVGFSLSEDSTEVVDISLLTKEFLEENGKDLYCVYQRSDTLALYSNAEFTKALQVRKASYVHYMKNGIETTVNHVYLLDLYEKPIEVNGVQYNFYGWSESAGSIAVVTISSNHYHLYAVYQNAETNELVSMISLS